MRVLLVCPLGRPWFTGYYLLNALRRMEIPAVAFDYRLYASKLGVEGMNKLLSQVVVDVNPDLILSLKAELVSPRLMSRQKATTALWFFDYVTPVPTWLLELAKAHDFFFSVCKGYLELFPKEVNGFFLPEAYDDTIIKPVEVSEEDRSKYGAEVAFIGTDKPRPCEILKKIAENGFDLKIWGREVSGGWKKAGLEEYWMGYRSTDLEFNKTCVSSKIVLGVSDRQKRDCNLCFSARVYQVLGARGFLLEERGKGIEGMFRDGVDLALWNDEDDLIGKIRYYLNHDDERARISRRGHKKVKKHHTFKVRMRQLLRKVGFGEGKCYS